MVTLKKPVYSIIFNGELRGNIRRKQAIETISRFTNIDQDEVLETLFSVKPIIITQTSDEALAREYRQAFQHAGLNVILEPTQAKHENIYNVDLSFGHYAPLERVESSPNFIVEITDDDTGESNAAPVANSGAKYTVVFEGKLNRGCSKQQAINNLCHLTKATETEVIENVFSVVPVIIIRTDNKANADDHVTAFGEAGLQLSLVEDCKECDEMVISPLTIRNDVPVILENKPVSRFFYSLLGLSLASVVIWAYVFFTFPGLFAKSQPETINIKLTYPAVLAPANPPETLPAPKTKPIETKPKTKQAAALIAKPAEKLAQEALKPQSSAANSIKKSEPLAPEQKTLRQNKNESLRKIEDDYFLSLLSWLASNTQTRQSNLEGEIKVRLTISRDGRLKNTEVLSSTSEKLTDVVLARVQYASPYPNVPDAIVGPEYQFVLPFKYELE